ncbi:MAG: ribosome small subunit-dependent GTPase A [Bacteroidales bacterium]|nr:ribosome small subunit-dependent GTPase A [Candidatus Colimorpha onthohippi]
MQLCTGLVLRTTGSWYRVLTNDGHTLDCRLRGGYRLKGSKQTNPIAVGDYVRYEVQLDGTGVIQDIEDRNNYIIRKATKLSKQTHVIAANLDMLCVVATLGYPRTSTGFIDRLLVTAQAYHIPACLIINKIDLYTGRQDLLDAHQHLVEIYRNVGYPVYEVSAKQAIGLDALSAAISGSTVLFSGHSGVGKSALLSALCPELHLKVGDISTSNLKGCHTTTFAEIYPVRLDQHPHATTCLVDTPGIKEFGMVDIEPWQLSHYFPEMQSLISQCRFATCTHTHEPQCAVKNALERGLIAPERYASYLAMLAE